MSETTPGPWTVELIGQDDLYGHVYISGHITSPLHTYCGNAKERTDSITAPDSMTRADAYLIAAAPMMLEALQAEEVAQAAWENCAVSGRSMDAYTRALCERADCLRRAALSASAPPPTADAGRAEDGG